MEEVLREKESATKSARGGGPEVQQNHDDRTGTRHHLRQLHLWPVEARAKHSSSRGVQSPKDKRQGIPGEVRALVGQCHTTSLSCTPPFLVSGGVARALE